MENNPKVKFVSSYCKHIMRICTKCGATFCKGECASWTQGGRGSYEISNAISRHNKHIPHEEITEKELCEFCK